MCLLLCVSQTLAGLPDQDSYYDMVDCLEEQGIEATAQRHLSRKGTDLDLVEQFNIYEVRKPTVQTFISTNKFSVSNKSNISRECSLRKDPCYTLFTHCLFDLDDSPS